MAKQLEFQLAKPLGDRVLVEIEMKEKTIGAKAKSQLLAWISEFTPIKN